MGRSAEIMARAGVAPCSWALLLVFAALSLGAAPDTPGEKKVAPAPPAPAKGGGKEGQEVAKAGSTKESLASDLKAAAKEKATASEAQAAKVSRAGNLTSGDKLWTAKTVAMVAASKARPHELTSGPMHSELTMLSHKFGQLKQQKKQKQEEVRKAAQNKVEAEHQLIVADQEAKKAEERMEDKMRALKLVVHQKQEEVIKAKHNKQDAEQKLKVAHTEQDKAEKRVDIAVDVVKQAAVEVDQEKSSSDVDDDLDPFKAEKEAKDLVNSARNSEFDKVNKKMEEKRGEDKVKPLTSEEVEPESVKNKKTKLKVKDFNAANYKAFEDAFNSALEHHGYVARKQGVDENEEHIKDKSFESELDQASSLATKRKRAARKSSPAGDESFEDAFQLMVQSKVATPEAQASEAQAQALEARDEKIDDDENGKGDDDDENGKGDDQRSMTEREPHITLDQT